MLWLLVVFVSLVAAQSPGLCKSDEGRLFGRNDSHCVLFDGVTSELLVGSEWSTAWGVEVQFRCFSEVSQARYSVDVNASSWSLWFSLYEGCTTVASEPRDTSIWKERSTTLASSSSSTTHSATAATTTKLATTVPVGFVLPVREIVGITLGVVAGLLIGGFVTWMCFRRHQRKLASAETFEGRVLDPDDFLRNDFPEDDLF